MSVRHRYAKHVHRKRIYTNVATAIASLLFHTEAYAAVCIPQWRSDVTADTTSLQQALDRCAGSSGHPGLVLLEAQHGISTVAITSAKLTDHLVLKVEKGFTLKGTAGMPASSAMLVGDRVTDMTLTGTGVIDGDGIDYWPSAVGKNNTPRPKLIRLTGTNLRIGSNFTDDGQPQPLVHFPTPTNDTRNALTIRNSPKEQLVIEPGSRNVVVDGVWIYANPRRNGAHKNLAPNTDAIDIIGTNKATIRNFLLDTGDDDIAIKSNRGSSTTADIHISHGVVAAGHGISIGGQAAAGHTLANPGVSRVRISDILFSGTDYGYRIKTDDSLKDSGAIVDISYARTCMLNVGQPFLFTYKYADGRGSVPPIIANVSVDNIVATATQSQGTMYGPDAGLDNGLGHAPNGIKITNTKISGGRPFLVDSGMLLLGSKSPLTVSTQHGGRVELVEDSGPSLACPATVVIPSQL